MSELAGMLRSAKMLLREVVFILEENEMDTILLGHCLENIDITTDEIYDCKPRQFRKP